MRNVYLVTTKFGACAGIVVQDDVIVEAAPIYQAFIGQAFAHIISWGQVTKIEQVN